MFSFSGIVTIVIILQTLLANEVKSEFKLSDRDIVRLKEFGKEIRENLPPKINPCENFYDYICENLQRNYSISNSKINEILLNYLEKAKELSAGEIKLKTYLQSVQQIANECTANEFVNEFIKNNEHKFGTWPALNPNWKPENFSLESALALVQQFDLKEELPFLPLKFTQDGHTVYFRISGYDYENTSFLQQHAELMNNAFVNIDILDIYNEITQNANDIISKFKDLGESHYSFEYTDFSSLKQNYPEFDWDKLVYVATGKTLRDDYPVEILDGKRLKKKLNIIFSMYKDTPKKIANFVFYEYIISMYTICRNSKSFHYSKTDFAPIINKLLLEIYYDDYVINGLQEFGKMLNKNFYNYIKNFDNSSDIIANYLDEKLKTENLAIFDNNCCDNEYAEITSFDPLTNYYAGFSHLIQQRLNPYGNTYSGKYFNQPEDRGFFLEALDKNFNEAPIFMYKTIGLILLHYNMLSTQGEGFKKPMENCLNMPSEFKLTPQTNDAINIQLLVNTYDEWTDKHHEIVKAMDEVLKEFGLTNKQIFLIASGQNWCNSFSPKRKEVSFYFSNTKLFAEVFSCPLGSPMNPEQKCFIENLFM